MSACCVCCVFSGTLLCVELITRPEESYRVWCVWVWSWRLDNEDVLAQQAGVEPSKYIYIYMYTQVYYKRNRHCQHYVVSPDLNSCDFFLWGYIKDRVFVSALPVKFKGTETTHHNSCCKCWGGYVQVCLDRIRLPYWCLSCDKRLTHRTFVT